MLLQTALLSATLLVPAMAEGMDSAARPPAANVVPHLAMPTARPTRYKQDGKNTPVMPSNLLYARSPAPLPTTFATKVLQQTLSQPITLATFPIKQTLFLAEKSTARSGNRGWKRHLSENVPVDKREAELPFTELGPETVRPKADQLDQVVTQRLRFRTQRAKSRRQSRIQGHLRSRLPVDQSLREELKNTTEVVASAVALDSDKSTTPWYTKALDSAAKWWVGSDAETSPEEAGPSFMSRMMGKVAEFVAGEVEGPLVKFKQEPHLRSDGKYQFWRCPVDCEEHKALKSPYGMHDVYPELCYEGCPDWPPRCFNPEQYQKDPWNYGADVRHPDALFLTFHYAGKNH